ncbi:hypothetical protein L2E82_27935 [Cichorium intybus]|uniref:Uncharacterized protein n=1 Tax=Cichorium intybus TaxID=13427 RepID=A0ACB9CUE2_CICIN|nr:hypothetical protein L2E82_27935 [Cichorium intybus]
MCTRYNYSIYFCYLTNSMKTYLFNVLSSSTTLYNKSIVYATENPINKINCKLATFKTYEGWIQLIQATTHQSLKLA